MQISVVTAALLMTASLPLAAMDVAPAPTQVQPSTAEICKQLTAATESIEIALLKIVDRQSADAASHQLHTLQQQTAALLAELEEAPADPSTAHDIMQTMMDITLIAQRYMPIVSRLQSLNAYGSQELMQLLNQYGSDDPYLPSTPDLQQTETLSQLIDQKCDLMGDVLYELRKTTDRTSAKAAAALLRHALSSQQQLNIRINKLPQPPPPEATQHQQPVTERCQQLLDELHTETARLKKAGYYDDPDLPSLLRQYIKAVN